jgi:hypothetical protein
MTVAEIIQGAIGLISDPEKFTVGQYAVNDKGYGVDCDHPAAVRFCALGACARVEGIRYPIEGWSWATVQDTCFDMHSRPMAEVNDTLGREAAINVLQEAIRRAQQQEANEEVPV